jgi:hypothetical protein
MNTCPNCTKIIDASTVIDGNSNEPSDGDITICAYCSHILKFNKDLSLSSMTTAEMQLLEPDKLFTISKVVHAIRQRVIQN